MPKRAQKKKNTVIFIASEIREFKRNSHLTMLNIIYYILAFACYRLLLAKSNLGCDDRLTSDQEQQHERYDYQSAINVLRPLRLRQRLAGIITITTTMVEGHFALYPITWALPHLRSSRTSSPAIKIPSSIREPVFATIIHRTR